MPTESFPLYGPTRRGLHYGPTFRVSPLGLLCRRGVMKLSAEEAERLSLSEPWLGAIFLAEVRAAPMVFANHVRRRASNSPRP